MGSGQQTARTADPSAQPLEGPAGDTWLGLTGSPLPVVEVGTWVIRPHCGAVVVFTGIARDHAGGRSGVTLLEYEAYAEHVVPTLRHVAVEAWERWPQLGRIAILHRVGPLQVTDPAVVVAVSAPHRAESFDAARFCIDEVKTRAPIWKREHWAGGVDWGRCDHDTDQSEDQVGAGSSAVRRAGAAG